MLENPHIFLVKTGSEENSWKRTRLRNFGKGDICVGIAGNGDDISAAGHCTAGKKLSHAVIAGSAQQIQVGAAEVQIR